MIAPDTFRNLKIKESKHSISLIRIVTLLGTEVIKFIGKHTLPIEFKQE